MLTRRVPAFRLDRTEWGCRRSSKMTKPTSAPEWRNGIRSRLKIDRPKGHAGSNPASGTIAALIESSKIGAVAPILPPDHKPIPTGFENLKHAAPKIVRTGVFSITLCPTLPVIQPHPVVQAIEQPQQADDPPSKDYLPPVSYSLDRGVQTTSSEMPFNQHDWPVPQRRSSSVHLTMASTNAALLFGSTSSDGMPFNNGDWPVPPHRTLHSSQMTFSTSDPVLFDKAPMARRR